MMKYNVIPSLERIAIVKIVSHLWNQTDIRSLIGNYSFPIHCFERKEKWQKIEDKVLEKVSNFQQPECLKEKISGVVKTIGLEMLKWMEYNFRDKDIVLHLPSKFFFTQLGAIDKQKTAELLVKDETLSVESRYRLACMYCLEDYLPSLWNKLSENSKCKLYRKFRPSQVYEHLFVIFFTYNLNGEQAQRFMQIYAGFDVLNYTQSFYVYLFNQAVCDGNIVATKYFYKKLTAKDRKFFLPKAAGDLVDSLWFSPDFIDVLLFLLSQMNQEEIIGLLRDRPYKALNDMLLCMLDWPWQGFFIDTIILMHNFIPELFYETFLHKIIHKVIEGYKDCCYLDIFSELCMQIPNKERCCILQKVCASANLLISLFKIKDKQNMKLILQDATPKSKQEFIVSCNGISICCKLMQAGEWDLLELLIQDCITSKDELVKFKEHFHEIVRSVLNCSDGWSKFVILLDSLAFKYDKRKSEEEINSESVKKFCNMNLKNNE